jgi:hypothetical protein
VNRALLVALATWILLSPSPAAPETEDELAQREQGQDLIALAQQDLARAVKNYDDALATYQIMRHRNRMRGARKRQVIEALENARIELADAQEAFDSAKTGARRAGVPPGWFRTTPPASTQN